MLAPNYNIGITTFTNLLLLYGTSSSGRDDRVKNLFDRLSRFLDSTNITEDKLYQLLVSLYNDIVIDRRNSYISDITKSKELLMFLPLRINLTVYEDGYGYLFANEKAFYINADLVAMLKDDVLTSLKPLGYEELNKLTKKHFNISTTDESYELSSNLLRLLECGIPTEDAMSLESHDDYVYITTNLPMELQDLFTDHIDNIRYVNSTKDSIINWIPDSLITDIININLTDLTYAVSRDVCNRVKATYNTYGKRAAYEVCLNILTSTWRDGDLTYVIKDFPFLESITNITSVAFIKTLAVGLRSEINTIPYSEDGLYYKDKVKVIETIKEKLNILG